MAVQPSSSYDMIRKCPLNCYELANGEFTTNLRNNFYLGKLCLRELCTVIIIVFYLPAHCFAYLFGFVFGL